MQENQKSQEKFSEEDFGSEQKQESSKSEKSSDQKPFSQGEQVNVMALISYISFLCLVPILSKSEDDFVMFHAKQGLVLFIAEIAGMIIGFIPFLEFITIFLNLIWMVLAILGIVNVVNGEKKKLPVLGQFANSFNL